MAQMPNRREQQRKKLLLLGIIVGVLLLSVIVSSVISSRISRNGGSTANDGRVIESENNMTKREVEASGQNANTSGSISGKTITYGGETYVYNDHLSNYLIMGVDTTGSIREEKEPGSAGQTDAIFLVSYDRAKETAAGLAIPRDTITQIEIFSPNGESSGYNSDHLNLQYAYGDGRRKSCELTTAAVSRLLSGIPVNGYAAINMESISELTEMLGGVEVTVPDDTLVDRNPDFTKGSKVILDASNTELFVRSRDTGIQQSAMDRMNRQKVFLEAYAAKLAREQRKDASTISKILDTMQPQMVTKMSNDQFADIATADRLGIQTIPGEGGHEGAYDVYRVDETELYKLVLRLFYEKEESGT